MHYVRDILKIVRKLNDFSPRSVGMIECWYSKGRFLRWYSFDGSMDIGNSRHDFEISRNFNFCVHRHRYFLEFTLKEPWLFDPNCGCFLECFDTSYKREQVESECMNFVEHRPLRGQIFGIFRNCLHFCRRQKCMRNASTKNKSSLLWTLVRVSVTQR